MCGYTGKYYCVDCHVNELSVIPARALHNWDFSKYKVCRASAELLNNTRRLPILDISKINPKLYVFVDEMRDLRVRPCA